MGLDKAEFTNHEAYLEIALENLKISQETDELLLEDYGVSSLTYYDAKLATEDFISLLPNLRIINKSNFISIVFSALFAESFINYYAISKGKNNRYLKDFNINRNNKVLSESVVKWIEIPNDIVGTFAINEGSTEAIDLQKLFSDRNKLAHHKAIVLNLHDIDFSNIQDPNSVTVEDAKNGYNATIKAIQALKKVDNTINISWLKN